MSTVPRIQISSLLNDAPSVNHLESTDLVDVRPQITHLARLLNGSGPIQAPRHALEQLSEIYAILNTNNLVSRSPSILLPAEADMLPLSPAGTPRRGSSLGEITSQQVRAIPTSPSRFSVPQFPSSTTPSISVNVKLNRQTVLSKMYTYSDVHAFVEYPQTSPGSEDAVGHLFRQDPDDWKKPAQNFAYSLGGPSGRNKDIYVDIFRGNDGERVPCSEYHFTCMYAYKS